jgi:glycerol kinase
LDYILALDQGTTSSRAILFDREGRVRGMAQKELLQIYPWPGWVEHDPMEIWSTQLGVASEVLARERVSPHQVRAIGVTNQRETIVVWESATGRPISNAIVWQDRRTAPLCARLKAEGFEPLLREKTGLLADPYFSGTKIAWILESLPGVRQRAEAGELLCGTVDTWLLWNLTGGRAHVTDASNASRTLLYNLRTGCWDDELLILLGIPRRMLPEVRSSSEVYAETSRELFGEPIPIAGIAGDQQAALFGQMCLRPGMAKNTYGTGCFLLMHIGDHPVISRHNLLTTVAWSRAEQTQYALEGSVFIGGAVVQWLRDSLGFFAEAGEIEQLAASVADSGGVCLVPAFTGLGAPHWDPYARGLLCGITRGTTKAHIARAALEAIAHQVADVLDAMRADSRVELEELRVDGGAAANNLLLQFQADLLGVPIVRPQCLETTALGAALLAGLAVGFWDKLEEAAARYKVDRRFEPSMPASEVHVHRARWARALERARGWETEDPVAGNAPE